MNIVKFLINKMPSYKAKAIILRTYKLGESDKIVKMYSGRDGIISAVAKGSRRIRSKFGGRLALFNLVDLEIASGKNLDIIIQAEILKSFKNISLDFYKFIFCELISEVILKTQSSGSEPSPSLFKLIYVCINEIDNLEIEDIKSLKKAACFFGAKFLKIIGYSPLLDVCCRCSIKMDDLYSFHKHKILFSIRYGGIVCGKCANNLKNKMVLTASSYRFLYDLFNNKLEDFRDIEVSSSVIKKIYKLIENYITYHTDCSIDSFKYLNKIAI
jgi:DNA repair protein RecO (recombination protein O)